MTDKQQTLGQLELEVLKIVWDKKACSVSDVAEILSKQKGYARTTILTVMQRLHKKGFLERSKNEGIFQYSPTEKKTTVMGNLVKKFVDNIMGGSKASLAMHLIDTDISADELKQIRQIIDDAIAAEEEQK